MLRKTILALLITVLIPTAALAWDDCPYGEIDDPYPGECSRYIDTDDDGICDHSQPAPEDRENEEDTALLTEGIDETNDNTTTYHLIPISVILIIAYVISHILSKKKIISIVNHRKLWNILLLITFLISAILGILLVIKINFNIEIPLPFDIIFWHVEIGIAMAVISIFHILWHGAYFKNLFKSRN